MRNAAVMPGWRRSRTLLLSGAALVLAGLGVMAWEHPQGTAGLELIEAPLLLVGILLLFEGFMMRRRERLLTDNPK